MKKFFTLVASILLAGVMQAQTIPNASMEVWQDFTGPTYTQPEFWNTPNPYTAMLGESVVTRSTDAFAGDYSARLETKSLLFDQFRAPGLITLASFMVNIITYEYTSTGGIALNEKVLSLSGKYKYTGVSNDSASVFMYCYRNEGGNLDTIGMGSLFLHDAADWTSFNLNMYYLSDHQPDTFNVIIMSSGITSLTPGSVLLIDSLNAETNVGIFDLEANPIQVQCYPNPAGDFVTFDSPESANQRFITLYDLQGKKLGEHPFFEQSVRIDVSPYSSGTLLYRVTDSNNGLATGTLVIQ